MARDSFPNYPPGVIAGGYRFSRRLDETLDGVSVRLMALYASHDSSKMARIANYSSFGASAAVSGLKALKDVDALTISNQSDTTLLARSVESQFSKPPFKARRKRVRTRQVDRGQISSGPPEDHGHPSVICVYPPVTLSG